MELLTWRRKANTATMLHCVVGNAFQLAIALSVTLEVLQMLFKIEKALPSEMKSTCEGVAPNGLVTLTSSDRSFLECSTWS